MRLSNNRSEIAIISLERGIPSKCESSDHVDYVPALCTHRSSLPGTLSRFEKSGDCCFDTFQGGNSLVETALIRVMDGSWYNCDYKRNELCLDKKRLRVYIHSCEMPHKEITVLSSGLFQLSILFDQLVTSNDQFQESIKLIAGH
ncbi:hypothetical protein DINM_003053 [Dirofilaria immitis]|nr:hypothetical protein [Dirofilaria immitis]